MKYIDKFLSSRVYDLFLRSFLDLIELMMIISKFIFYDDQNVAFFHYFSKRIF
jgi:hypothetical protein